MNQVHKVSVSLLLVMPFFDSTWIFDSFGRVDTELWHGQRIRRAPKTCARKSSGITGHAGIFRNSLENARLNERRLHGLELITASSSYIRLRLFLQTSNVPIACRSGPRWRYWAVARRDQCEIRLGRALPALAYSSEHLLCSMLWTTCNWTTTGSVKLEKPWLVSFWCKELITRNLEWLVLLEKEILQVGAIGGMGGLKPLQQHEIHVLSMVSWLYSRSVGDKSEGMEHTWSLNKRPAISDHSNINSSAYLYG